MKEYFTVTDHAGSFRSESKDDLQAPMVQTDPGLQGRPAMEDCEEGYRMVEAISHIEGGKCFT
jgi:hypothetical protein